MQFFVYKKFLVSGYFFFFNKEYNFSTEISNFLISQFSVGFLLKNMFIFFHELHISNPILNKKFIYIGKQQLIRFCLLLADLFCPMSPTGKFYLFNHLWQFKCGTRKIKLFLNKLPTRGQRNHSNASTIRRDIQGIFSFASALKILESDNIGLSHDIFLPDRIALIIKLRSNYISQLKQASIQETRRNQNKARTKTVKKKTKKKKFNIWG